MYMRQTNIFQAYIFQTNIFQTNIFLDGMIYLLSHVLGIVYRFHFDLILFILFVNQVLLLQSTSIECLKLQCLVCLDNRGKDQVSILKTGRQSHTVKLQLSPYVTLYLAQILINFTVSGMGECLRTVSASLFNSIQNPLLYHPFFKPCE